MTTTNVNLKDLQLKIANHLSAKFIQNMQGITTNNDRERKRNETKTKQNKTKKFFHDRANDRGEKERI